MHRKKGEYSKKQEKLNELQRMGSCVLSRYRNSLVIVGLSGLCLQTLGDFAGVGHGEKTYHVCVDNSLPVKSLEHR